MEPTGLPLQAQQVDGPSCVAHSSDSAHESGA
jgi:hypothetical protein